MRVVGKDKIYADVDFKKQLADKDNKDIVNEVLPFIKKELVKRGTSYDSAISSNSFKSFSYENLKNSLQHASETQKQYLSSLKELRKLRNKRMIINSFIGISLIGLTIWGGYKLFFSKKVK